MIGIAFTLIKEIFLGIAFKITTKAIMERFATRLVIYGLNKLKNQTSNTVVQGTVDDVIKSLRGKGLKVVEEEC